MKYLELFEKFSVSDSKLKELAHVSDDYQNFLENVESNTRLFILYRGTDSDTIEDESFFGDFLTHAESYGDFVDGLIIPNKNEILYYDDNVFSYIRENIHLILVPNIPNNWEFEEYESIFKESLNKIYSNYFKNGKLSDAMYQLDCDEKCVIDYVYNFCFESNKPYSKVSQSKENDFLIPLMLYISTKRIKKPKNIISFYGSDFYGSNEYVVNDINRYVKLSDVWKKYKKTNI